MRLSDHTAEKLFQEAAARHGVDGTGSSRTDRDNLVSHN
jgi:hypothetical protein